MNMATKMVLIAVMAITFDASASDRNAQMMRERNVPPSVLADRVEACLRTDPTGTVCKPEGSNATPADYVTSINANPDRKVLVQNVADLPRFLRGLRSGPFTGEQCLSGMNGGDVAAYCRNVRAPHPGEVAWWAGDTFVLAGDCLNARVGFHVPTMQTVEATGKKWQPYAARQWTDPYAGQTTGEQCPLEGARLTGIHVFAQEALNTPCAQQYVINPARYTSGRGTVGGYVRTGSEDVFSLKCGRAMHEAANAGQIGWSRQAHPVELVLIRNGQSEPIFKGTVTGNILAASDENSATLLTPDNKFVDVPPELTTGTLVWMFPQGGMASPTATGAGMDISRLQRSEGCRGKPKVASAIEGVLNRVAYEE